VLAAEEAQQDPVVCGAAKAELGVVVAVAEVGGLKVGEEASLNVGEEELLNVGEELNLGEE
jgi:hypothetical protein